MRCRKKTQTLTTLLWTIMKTEKLLIDFRSGTSAFERNQQIRLELERRDYKEVLKGILIRQDGTLSEKFYENHELEKADRIEIHFI